MKSPEQAMPWVGLYIAVASLVCTLAMAADVFQGFRQRKLWFPCRFFTLNAASITLIGIAMKLPVDLTTDTPGDNDKDARSIGISFLFTMLANFLPSLGGMDDKGLFTNIIALGILIIAIILNMCIQATIIYASLESVVLYMCVIISLFLWPFLVALTVPTSKRVLEHQYQELHRSALDHQEIKFSSNKLIRHVKKYWMMAETGNPQFVLATSSFCSASALICTYFSYRSISFMMYPLTHRSPFGDQTSDYKWSNYVFLTVQNFGIIVGSIAPIFRCITSVTYFNLSKKWSINHINMFRVEKHWTKRLQQWKLNHVTSYMPGRHRKKAFNHVKNMILNFAIAFQVMFVVISKTICLFPTCIVLLFYCFCHFFNSFLRRCKKDSDASNNTVRSEIEEYIGYVIQVEEGAKLSKGMLRNMLRSIINLLHNSEKEQPTNLVKFLGKSTGFNGVAKFDIDQVPPLHPEEIHNCWSLVAVTLTTIALALPNIENGHVKELLASLSEGLQFVQDIEETLNAKCESLKARKTARRIWTEVDVYRTWLQIDLQKKARRGKTSKEILQWLVDEAIKIVIQFKRSKKRSQNDSFHMFIAASSMYRISQTILLHCNEEEDWPTDMELFEWISTIIADLLCACFTNLPRVIVLKCHHDAIEKRGESIRTAAQLLGKSKTILNILEGRQLPDLDLNSMAYIDKWQRLPKSQIPSGCASPTTSSNFNESLIVTIV